MKKNIGKTDENLRLLVTTIIGVVLYFQLVTGALIVVFGIIGLILFTTAVSGVCPLYSLFGTSTCSR